MKKRKKNRSSQIIETFPINSHFVEANSTNISLHNPLSVKNKKITRLGEPLYSNDLVSWGYLKSKFLDKNDKETGYLSTKGGRMNGEINIGNFSIKKVQFPMEDKNAPRTIEQLPDKEKNSAINAASVINTVSAIENDSYLNQVENTIRELNPNIEKLENLLGIKSPPEPDNETSSPLEGMTLAISDPGLKRVSKTNSSQIDMELHATTKANETIEIPYVAVAGDKMSGNLDMGGKSVRGLPMSPQKEFDAASLGYLRTKFACGGCIMRGNLSLSKKSDNATPTYSKMSGSIINLKTPTTTESHYASNLEFIKQRLPGPKFSFMSVINEGITYILENGLFNWGVGVNNQSPDIYKYTSALGTALQLRPNVFYTLYWTAIVSINLPEEIKNESKKKASNKVLYDIAPTETTRSYGKLTLKLMAPIIPEKTKDANKKRSPDPDTGETAPIPEPEPDASIIATYPINECSISLSCQIPIPPTSLNSSQTERNSGIYSLYLEFDSSVKIEYSNWNLLVRPFPLNYTPS
ncbi:hypothetical protein [Chlamydiifrater volucris]|uniref:hypothetical protein n=1 Tax=Chlamydiifrater volucris TaxID=2681470 RepID=UPI001BCC2C78|nr:hypothetical protein [Chlamydiifrater volucris]